LRGLSKFMHARLQSRQWFVTRRKQQWPGIAKDDKNNGTNKSTNTPTMLLPSTRRRKWFVTPAKVAHTIAVPHQQSRTRLWCEKERLVHEIRMKRIYGWSSTSMIMCSDMLPTGILLCRRHVWKAPIFIRPAGLWRSGGVAVESARAEVYWTRDEQPNEASVSISTIQSAGTLAAQSQASYWGRIWHSFE